MAAARAAALVPDNTRDTTRLVSPSSSSPRPGLLPSPPPSGSPAAPAVNVQHLLRQQRQKASKQRTPLRQRLRAALLWLAALLVSGGAMALLFLVPLVVDPAISTIRADIVPAPAACRTERVERYDTLSNCSWSSCREGCTSTIYQCVHVYVTYELDSDSAADSSFPSTTGPHPAVLLVNVNTCGYPPRVNCSAFELQYAEPGSTFPCYVSRTNASVAVSDYQPGEATRLLLGSIGMPAGAMLLGAITVCLLQMRPAAWKRRKIGLTQALKPKAQRVWSTSSSADGGDIQPFGLTRALSTVPESRDGSAPTNQLPPPPPPPPPPPRPPP